MQQNLHILYLTSANDAREYLDQLKKERQAIERVLSKASAKKLLQIIKELNLDLNDLFNVFDDLDYRGRIKIFHYAGHSNTKSIMLEAKDGATKEVSIEDFSDFMGLQKGVQLIFLNSCLSENLANSLIEKGVPVVIGTETSIVDGDAALFAEKFYQALGGGKTIGEAYQQADIYFRNHLNELTGNYRKLDIGDNKESEMPWLIHSKNDEALDWSILPAKENKTPPPKISRQTIEEDIRGDLAVISCDRRKILRKFDLQFLENEEKEFPCQFFFLSNQPNGEVESILRRLVCTLQNEKQDVKPIKFDDIFPQEVEYFPGEDLDDIKYSLRKAFNRVIPKKNQVKSLNEFAKKIDLQFPKFQYSYLPFIFKIQLATNNCWEELIEPALKWFINDFSKLEKGNDFTQRSFIFFFIIGQQPEKAKVVKKKDWSRLFKKSSSKPAIKTLDIHQVLTKFITKNEPTVVLPPLQQVDEEDLDFWYRRYEKNADERGRLVAELVKKIEKRTEHEAPWDMSPVEAELKIIVENRQNHAFGI